MIISPQIVNQIPMHDAEILVLLFPPAKNGFNDISIQIRMPPDENLEVLQKIGIAGRDLWLSFKDCWRINTRIIGYCSGRELISSFEIVEDSQLLEELRSFGLGKADTVHFKIEGSHGSQFDILSDVVSVDNMCR